MVSACSKCCKFQPVSTKLSVRVIIDDLLRLVDETAARARADEPGRHSRNSGIYPIFFFALFALAAANYPFSLYKFARL